MVAHVVVLTSNIPRPAPSTNPSALHHHSGITSNHLGITTSERAEIQLKLSQQTAYPDVDRARGAICKLMPSVTLILRWAFNKRSQYRQRQHFVTRGCSVIERHR